MIHVRSSERYFVYSRIMVVPRALAIAIVSTTIALGLRWLMGSWLGDQSPIMIFVLPVLVSGYFGGFLTGLFATLLSAFLGNLFLVKPIFSLGAADFQGEATVVLFIVIGVSISAMAPFARRGQLLAVQMVQQDSEREVREAALEEKAVQDERQRLSRELHDSVSQALYGIGLGARTALARLQSNPSEVEGALRYVLALSESGLAEMRALVHELRPEMLESEGLAAALTYQAQALAGRYGLQAVLHLDEPEVSLTHKHGLYRITMEALHNVVKHANAARLEVTLVQDSGVLVLEVSDDGKGFDSAELFPGRWGIRTMRERVERLGGTLRIGSDLERGTVVRVDLPCGRGLPARSETWAPSTFPLE